LEKGAYSGENDSKVNTEVRDPTYREKEMESKSFSEASKSPLKTTKPSEESSSIPAYQYKDQNQGNFITLSQILEQEKIEIIQLGFQLQAQGTISLKKYYESTQEYSLFQLKGYNIKYETIRRTKLYQSLKA
jgi:hypothetical protein